MKKPLFVLSLIFVLISCNSCIPLGIVATASSGAMIAEERSFGNVIDDNVIINKLRYQLSRHNQTFKNVNYCKKLKNCMRPSIRMLAIFRRLPAENRSVFLE